MSYAPITKNGVDNADGLFDEAPAPAYARIELETVVTYEGFTFRVVFRDTSIGDAAAVLKKRGCLPAQAAACEAPAPEAPGTMPETEIPPTCPIHHRPMKAMKYPSKTGQRWHCTAKVGDDWCAERC